MRSAFFAFLLSAAMPVHAATVVIDFESTPVGATPTTPDPAEWVSNGFLISGSDDVANGSFPGGVVAPGVGFSPVPLQFGQRSLLFCGNCGALEFVLTQQNGQAFDLHSFDLAAAFPGGGDSWVITGTLSGGGEVQTSITSGDGSFSFGVEWVDLQSVSFELPPAGNALDYRLDNIVVTAVPIPAAVWLFGSALAGLGWMRRK